MFYLVAYDIADTRRRNKVLDILRDFGIPVQRSVVECELDPGKLGILRERVQGVIRRAKDQVRFYPLCGLCLPRSEVLGAETIPLSGRRKEN